jgi:hypothetical protein
MVMGATSGAVVFLVTSNAIVIATLPVTVWLANCCCTRTHAKSDSRDAVAAKPPMVYRWLWAADLVRQLEAALHGVTPSAVRPIFPPAAIHLAVLRHCELLHTVACPSSLQGRQLTETKRRTPNCDCCRKGFSA